MSGVFCEDLKFYFADAKRGKLLLADTGDFINNVSCALFHYLDKNHNTVYQMRDNLKNLTEYVQRDASNNMKHIGAALLILALKEFFGKTCLRRILYVGDQHRLTRVVESISKMMPIFHEENKIYILSNQSCETRFDNCEYISSSYKEYPFPSKFFDLVVVSDEAVLSRMPDIMLSIKRGGLFLAVVPLGVKAKYNISAFDSLNDDVGNRLLLKRVTNECHNLFFNATDKGKIEQQKKLISYIYDEVGGALVEIQNDNNKEQLDAVIEQAKLAENIILNIYEYLFNDDIKYLANRFKESLIEYRLHSTDDRYKKVLDSYLVLHDVCLGCDEAR